MAINPGSPDNLDVEMGLSGVDDLGRDADRAADYLERAAETINKAFESNSNTGKKFNDALLRIEKQVLSLTRQYANLGKSGAAGFQEIESRQAEALAQLTDLQAKLRDLDVESAKKGTKKSRLAELTKEAKEVKKEISVLEHDLVQLQQLDIILKAKIKTEIIPPTQNQYSFDSGFNKQILSKDKAAFTLQNQLTKLSELKFPGADFIADQAKDALVEVNKLIDTLGELKTDLNTATDFQTVSDLKKELALVDKELNDIASDTLKLQRLDLESVRPKEVNPEVARKKFLDIDKDILSKRQKFTELSKFEGDDPVSDAIRNSATNQLSEIRLAEQDLKKLKDDLRVTTDKTVISDLVDKSKFLVDYLAKLDNLLVDIARKKLSIPEVPKADKAIDPDILGKKLLQQEKSALALETQLTRLSKLKFRGSENIVIDSRTALTQIEAITTKINRIQSDIRSTTDQTLLTSLRDQAKDLEGELDTVQSALIKLRREEAAEAPEGGGGEGGGEGSGIIDFLKEKIGIQGLTELTVLGLAGSAFSGAQKALEYGQIAIERAVEATRVNRLLAGSALEASIAYDQLIEKNKKFADQVGLSEVQASSTSARIAQLATRTQKPEDIDKLFKGFADLGAARGLNATELEVIIQQIITGQDEGYKKLLLPNPSQLYEEYARKNNRTSGSLSAVEKSQIFQEKFLEKADLFNGAAEARMQSLDGRVAKLNATLENLRNTAAKKIAGSYEFVTFIDVATKALSGFNIEIDDLASKVRRGINIDELIKKQAKPNALVDIGQQTLKGFYMFMSGFSTLANTITLRTSKGLNDAPTNFSDAAVGLQEEYQKNYREDFLRQQVNAEIRQRAIDQKNTDERRVEIARLNAEEDRTRLASVEEKKFSEIFRNPRSSIQDIEKAVADIQSFSTPIPKSVDESELQKRVSEELKKTDRALYTGLNDAQIGERLAVNIRKELQAAVDVQNKSLFEEDDQEKLVQRAKQELSNVVQKAYKQVIDDPKINVANLFAELGKIKGDTRLFPEVQEDLTREVEGKIETISKKLYQLKTDFGELLLTNNNPEDNALVKALNEVNKVSEETRKKFASLGEEFSTAAANIAKVNAERKIVSLEYEGRDKGLKLRQEARRLEQTPSEAIDGFQRRLSTVEKEIDFELSDLKLKRLEEEDRFYGTQYRSGGRDFLTNKLGYNGVSRLTRDAAPQQNGETFENYNQRISKYLEISLKIKDSFEEISKLNYIDTRNTGLYGQEARAKALLDRLPGRDELLQRLNSTGQTREEARQLLVQRADAEAVLREANEKRFKDFLQNQQFVELGRKDAQERINLLETSGKGLTDIEKINQFLNIVNELGTAELTPQLRTAKIRTLNAKAEVEENQRKTAEAQMAKITNVMTSIQEQLDSKGLKVDLGDTPLVELTVDTQGQASVTSRPNPNNVRSGRN